MEVRELESNENIVCPFCNEVVIDFDAEDLDGFNPCSHVILIATDESIDEFDEELIDLEALEEKMDEEDLTYDDAISTLDIPNTILLKQYQPAPSFFGAYHLFKAE